jgi:hypothetical protein
MDWGTCFAGLDGFMAIGTFCFGFVFGGLAGVYLDEAQVIDEKVIYPVMGFFVGAGLAVLLRASGIYRIGR